MAKPCWGCNSPRFDPENQSHSTISFSKTCSHVGSPTNPGGQTQQGFPPLHKGSWGSRSQSFAQSFSTIYKTRFRTAKNLCDLSFFLQQQLIVATSQATQWREELIHRKRWHLLPRKGYVVTTQLSLRNYHHHYNHQNPLPYLEFITFLLSSFAKMFRKQFYLTLSDSRQTPVICL